MNKLGLIKLGNSSLELHSADLANFGRSQTISLVSRPKFAKNYESQTENPSVVVVLPRIYESKRESVTFRHCEAIRRIAEAIQNINESRVSATESRPIRGAKNRIQGRSSASADFLLESEKRGTPPKSEKAAAFWRVGGAGRGVQPFLRKNSSEIDYKGFAESSLYFVNYAKVAREISLRNPKNSYKCERCTQEQIERTSRICAIVGII